MNITTISLEYAIQILSIIIVFLLLLKFVPRYKIREANQIFLFKQFLTWILGLAVAEYKLIEYPVRFFAYATRASFTFEYLVYPAICVLFNLHYPERKSPANQLLYYVIYSSAIAITEAVLERYTNVIVYINWHWYYTWISIFATFFISRLYYRWFFKK